MRSLYFLSDFSRDMLTWIDLKIWPILANRNWLFTRITISLGIQWSAITILSLYKFWNWYSQCVHFTFYWNFLFSVHQSFARDVLKNDNLITKSCLDVLLPHQFYLSKNIISRLWLSVSINIFVFKSGCSFYLVVYPVRYSTPIV